MASTSTIFLVLRIYCRSVRTRMMWWDDYLLIIGWMFLMIGVSLQTVVFGSGYLVTTLSGPIITPANLASDNAMKLSLAFSKTSFALTLLRFTTGWLRPVIILITCMTDIMCLVHTILVWRPTCGAESAFSLGSCWSINSGTWMNMIGSIVSAVTDFGLALIPIYSVWDLQMVKREKAGVAIAMSIGVLAGIVAVLKAVEALEVTRVVGTEFSRRLAVLSIWIHAEPNATIVAASIPVLRVLIRDVAKSFASYHPSAAHYVKSDGVFQSANLSNVRATSINSDHDSETVILPIFKPGTEADDRYRAEGQEAVELRKLHAHVPSG
ncbi:hypothetical protein CTAM01_02542 [Colletotrichum tamarilloi]|uniref:Rhodopsin domain-containing protein n=1 Tax=Colletotrichum tamarilloi TaxID=1209934 RepID=A0ABQ9RLQ2_9PEZI|nr:uncharacterized protein CTAM01_02542 [Colletotrichum tamarilloi]KAK1507430.1 hypothetical protein CTAM01_02542 [Colletotrichum tamarilloi]